jgi:hypothetical protein
VSYDFNGDEGRPDDPVPVGVCCGGCGGSIYFERCMDQNDTNHEWAVAGECQTCGARHPHTCMECGATDKLAVDS